MLVSYGFAFPENTLLLLLPPPPQSFRFPFVQAARGCPPRWRLALLGCHRTWFTSRKLSSVKINQLRGSCLGVAKHGDACRNQHTGWVMTSKALKEFAALPYIFPSGPQCWVRLFNRLALPHCLNQLCVFIWDVLNPKSRHWKCPYTVPSGWFPTWQKSFVPNTPDLNTAVLWRKCKSGPELEPISNHRLILFSPNVHIWVLKQISHLSSNRFSSCSLLLSESFKVTAVCACACSCDKQTLKVALKASVLSDCVDPHLLSCSLRKVRELYWGSSVWVHRAVSRACISRPATLGQCSNSATAVFRGVQRLCCGGFMFPLDIIQYFPPRFQRSFALSDL